MINKNQKVATILLIEGALSLMIGVGFGFAVLLADRHENAGKLVNLSIVFILAGIGFLAYRFHSFVFPERREELTSQAALRLRDQMREYDVNMAPASASIKHLFRKKATGYGGTWVSTVGVFSIFFFLILVIWRGFYSGAGDTDRNARKGASAISSTPMTLGYPPGIQQRKIAWQETFDFPGCNKRLEGNQLTVAFPSPIIDGIANITPDGELYLDQLAAQTIASKQAWQLDVLSYGTGVTGKIARVKLGLQRSSAIAEYLLKRGIPPDHITIRGSEAMPDELNYSQVVRLSIRPRTTE